MFNVDSSDTGNIVGNTVFDVFWYYLVVWHFPDNGWMEGND